jgi:hypothetical protein
MNKETISSLRFFLENIDQFDNTPIRKAANDISVVSLVVPPVILIKTSFVSKQI